MKKLLIILLFVAFWFRGHTLYWTINGEFRPEWKMNFMSGYKEPNIVPIERIEVTKTNVKVIAGEYSWTVIYGDTPDSVEHWWVANPERI